MGILKKGYKYMIHSYPQIPIFYFEKEKQAIEACNYMNMKHYFYGRVYVKEL